MNGEKFIPISIILIILLLIFGIGSAIKRQDWLDSHCKVMGEMSSSTGIGISTNGSVTPTFIAGKTGYQCDDGKQYWE